MRIPAGWFAGTQRVGAECLWRGCGQPAGVDVILVVPGEPVPARMRIGSYCLGHAVIRGIEAQTCDGRRPWYVACSVGSRS